MRMVFGLVLLVGLGLAGFAVYMAQGYINTYQAELNRERQARAAMVPTVDVYVVNRQVRYGERLFPKDVRIVKWPENAIPEGAFQTQEALFPDGVENLDQEGVRSVLRTMEKDEAVLAVKVSLPGRDAGVSSRLSSGMRAFAIRVDVTSGVSGFLRPGDRVDVYWTGRTAGLTADQSDVTKLIEANVKIIAVDQTADEDRNSPLVARTVTVEATPQEVGALAQAQATGRLSLSLVGAEETANAGSIEINQRELLGIEEKVIVEAPKERVCTVRKRSGTELIVTEIPCTN